VQGPVEGSDWSTARNAERDPNESLGGASVTTSLAARVVSRELDGPAMAARPKEQAEASILSKEPACWARGKGDSGTKDGSAQRTVRGCPRSSGPVDRTTPFELKSSGRAKARGIEESWRRISSRFLDGGRASHVPGPADGFGSVGEVEGEEVSSGGDFPAAGSARNRGLLANAQHHRNAKPAPSRAGASLEFLHRRQTVLLLAPRRLCTPALLAGIRRTCPSPRPSCPPRPRPRLRSQVDTWRLGDSPLTE
jgi:hypothetical protein